MSKYSATAAQDLLEKEKDGITLKDYLVSAMGKAILEFTEDDNLAVIALADDLVPGVLEELAGLDLNDYEIEPEDALTMNDEKSPAETQTELLNFRLELMHENLIGIQAILQSFLGTKEILEGVSDSLLVSLDGKQLDSLEQVNQNRRIKDHVEGLIRSAHLEGNQ